MIRFISSSQQQQSAFGVNDPLSGVDQRVINESAAVAAYFDARRNLQPSLEPVRGTRVA